MNTLITMSLCLPVPGLVKARLDYDENVPYIVAVTFDLGPESEPVVWELGRDLVRDGLIRPTGEGDVFISPGDGSRTVFLRLASEEGAAILYAPRQALHDFLKRTAKVVPYGREENVPAVRASLDRELRRILHEAC